MRPPAARRLGARLRRTRGSKLPTATQQPRLAALVPVPAVQRQAGHRHAVSPGRPAGGSARQVRQHGGLPGGAGSQGGPGRRLTWHQLLACTAGCRHCSGGRPAPQLRLQQCHTPQRAAGGRRRHARRIAASLGRAPVACPHRCHRPPPLHMRPAPHPPLCATRPCSPPLQAYFLTGKGLQASHVVLRTASSLHAAAAPPAPLARARAVPPAGAAQEGALARRGGRTGDH